MNTDRPTIPTDTALTVYGKTRKMCERKGREGTL